MNNDLFSSLRLLTSIQVPIHSHMNFFKSTLPFSALGIVFLILGIVMSDPRQFSFGIVWLLIATAKHVLFKTKEKANRPN